MLWEWDSAVRAAPPPSCSVSSSLTAPLSVCAGSLCCASSSSSSSNVHMADRLKHSPLYDTDNNQVTAKLRERHSHSHRQSVLAVDSRPMKVV